MLYYSGCASKWQIGIGNCFHDNNCKTSVDDQTDDSQIALVWGSRCIVTSHSRGLRSKSPIHVEPKFVANRGSVEQTLRRPLENYELVSLSHQRYAWLLCRPELDIQGLSSSDSCLTGVFLKLSNVMIIYHSGHPRKNFVP